jgi:threonine/homoserine/homoserine lactone efflux protein
MALVTRNALMYGRRAALMYGRRAALMYGRRAALMTAVGVNVGIFSGSRPLRWASRRSWRRRRQRSP